MEFSSTNLAALCFSILHFHVHHVFVLISLSILCLQKPAFCFSNKLGNETDQLALLELKAKIDDDPYEFFSSWNASVNFCKWQGVTCTQKNQRVVSLNLQSQSLLGTISPSIKNLTFLSFLNLANNRFHGEIPQEMSHLFRLRVLNLSVNSLGGEIPGKISNCSELRIMDFFTNNLTGKIPAQLGSLKKLVTLRLGKNNLIGEIPHSLGNLSSLETIHLIFNNLQGKIPNEMGQLSRLAVFSVGANYLSGRVPSSVYNISSITAISTAQNLLYGTLPSNIGLTLPNLKFLGIAANGFFGSIPVSLINASQLELIDISNNSFTGQVPSNLGNLKGLQQVHVEFNFLGSNTSQDLSFVTSLVNCSNLEQLYFDGNNFGGVLPSSIANLSTLYQLGFGRNQITGAIPEEIGNLVNLFRLDMDENLFSGSIPISFGKLQKLERLTLNGNLLSGEIPPSLFNITKLYWLQLADNKLEGNITPSIGNCKNLRFLDFSKNNLIGIIPKQISGLSSLSTTLNLSHNSLTGPLPSEVGTLKSVNALDVSENKLIGEIPMTIGDCSSLEIFNMQGNYLQGPIHSSFSFLKALQQLDLSRNNLSGNIPKELEQLLFLQYLNLSFNNLGGEVPKTGVFRNTSEISLDGNRNLCGGISQLQLPACPAKEKKNKMSSRSIILITTFCSVVLFMTITCFFVFYWRKSRKNPISIPFTVDTLPQISYQELLRATGGFSSENLVGQGSFGSVYKGILDWQGKRLVAVKVLNLEQHGASKSFIAECKALKDIRHRNLVKIWTYCSSIDFKGNDFKAIVFNFMENGSLEMWLHPKENGNSNRSRNLSLVQRLRIAIDVASALHYLHDHCETAIIHCDLKPSNILLDNDMTAHVADFGLARLLSNNTRNPSDSLTCSTGMKGTIGYMAPEYGVGSTATTYGDVYNFGILLLEMFTGKRPTDEVFINGLDLHKFVKTKLIHALDPTLFTREEETDDDDSAGILTPMEVDIEQECIVSVLQIGVDCSAEVPRERPTMKDVTSKLNVIMDAFLRAYRLLV